VASAVSRFIDNAYSDEGELPAKSPARVASTSKASAACHFEFSIVEIVTGRTRVALAAVFNDRKW
jgi:hypothetical protein